MMKKWRVCHLTNVHCPTDTRIFRKECTSLHKAGYEVTLIVASSDALEPAEFNIINVGAVSGRIRRMTIAAYRVYREARRLNADIYHLHDPEMLPWGLLLRLKGKKVIFDLHEDVSKQIYSKHWLPGSLKGPVSRVVWLMETLFMRCFSACVAATPEIAKSLANRHIIVVQNFPLQDELKPPKKRVSRSREIVFVGALTEARCAWEIISAVELASKLIPVTLHIIGKITPDYLLLAMKASSAWRYVNYHGWGDRPTISNIMARCSAGLVVFKAHPNHINAQPNKLFEYMSAELPVIASDFPLWRQLVNEASAGYLVDPENPKDIANAINRILEDPVAAAAMGENGRRAIKETLNWENEKEKLLQLYEDLLQ